MPTILKEFEPLFREYFYMVDMVGGRGGARSYHLTLKALKELMYNRYFRGFFIRQTHSTIYSSVWADFKDRTSEMIEECGELPNIELSDNKQGENYAKNKITGASIVTKGFKAGSGSHTANLKSLAGATHIFLEECEENDKSEFNKLILSLRKKGAKIQIIRAFNPPPLEHWIWGDYDLHPITNEDIYNIMLKVCPDEPSKLKALAETNKFQFLQAKPKDNRLFIQTNYYNNYQNLNELAINKIETDKFNDFLYYCVSILGLITSGSERSVYNGWVRIDLQDFDNAEGDTLYSLDFGDVVPNALTHIKFNGERRYYKQLLYTPDKELPILIALERLVNSGELDKTKLIIADSASPNQISAIRAAGYNIRAVGKSHDANIKAIKDIRNSKVYVYGQDLWNEYVNYKYEENKTGTILEDQVPLKGNDHLMDSIKYGEIAKKYVTR